jgi:hypothetical protein
MNEKDILDHYEIALKILAETSPDGDTAEDFKKWIACMRLLAYNALHHNSLDLEWAEILQAGIKAKGRTIHLKK